MTSTASGKPEPVSATIRIVGHDLPGIEFDGHRNVHVAAQRGRDVIDQVRGDVEQVEFEMPIGVAADAELGVDYRGPFVQGKRGERFLYLNWGNVEPDGEFVGFRRAKLKFELVPEAILSALAAGASVTVRIGLTDGRGGPLCATIPAAAMEWTVD